MARIRGAGFGRPHSEGGRALLLRQPAPCLVTIFYCTLLDEETLKKLQANMRLR